MTVTYPILAPNDGDELDPAWGADVTEAANDFNTRLTTLESLQTLSVVKLADEAVVTATMQDDNELFLSVAANTRWIVTEHIVYTAHAAGLISVSHSAPAGAAFEWVANGLATTVTAADQGIFTALARSLGDLKSLGCAGSSTLVVCKVTGLLTIGATAGTFRFRWSQGITSVNGTTVKATSFMLLQQIP